LKLNTFIEVAIGAEVVDQINVLGLIVTLSNTISALENNLQPYTTDQEWDESSATEATNILIATISVRLFDWF
jgi:hypothetical protein